MLRKEMFIEDVVREYPEAVRPLAKAGLVCVACGEPLWGTLAELAREKGLQDVDNILNKINRHLKSRSEELK
jgi:methionine synthase II (cobalamin-independent)